MRRAATAAIVAEHLRRHKTVDARLGALLSDHKTLMSAVRGLSSREMAKLKIADAYRTVAMLRERLQGVYNYGPASRCVVQLLCVALSLRWCWRCVASHCVA